MSTLTSASILTVAITLDSREGFRKLITSTLAKQAEAAKFASKREQLNQEAVAAAEKKHGLTAKIETLDAEILASRAALKEWLSEHREAELGGASTIKEAGAKIGWIAGRWSVLLTDPAEKEAEKAKAAVKALQNIIAKGEKENAPQKQKDRAAIARRYLKTKVELSKADALKDRENKDAAAVLAACFVEFQQGEEEFVFEPLA